jgi:hypothetical protein
VVRHFLTGNPINRALDSVSKISLSTA